MSLRPPQIEQFLAAHVDCILVDVADVKGSTPREAGAFMLVAADLFVGTIGGGQLEFIAIDSARAMLRNGVKSKTLSVPLGPEIGQCCGGGVELELSKIGAAQRDSLMVEAERQASEAPDIYVFGGGHVGRALAGTLAALPYQTTLVDTRADALLGLPQDISIQLAALPEAVVRKAKPSSAFVVLTHDHALDFLIMGEVLKREDARYAGMIGSKSKRAQFARWFRQEEEQSRQLEALICPMGAAGLGDKRPEIIAVLIAAEIISKFGNEACARPIKSAKFVEQIGALHGA